MTLQVGELYHLVGHLGARASLYKWRLSEDRRYWEMITNLDEWVEYLGGDLALVLARGAMYRPGTRAAIEVAKMPGRPTWATKRFYLSGQEAPKDFVAEQQEGVSFLFLHTTGISILQNRYFRALK